MERAAILLGGDDFHELAVLRTAGHELHLAVRRREQGVVAAETDVQARMEVGAALTHDDVAGENLLAAVALDAQSLGF